MPDIKRTQRMRIEFNLNAPPDNDSAVAGTAAARVAARQAEDFSRTQTNMVKRIESLEDVLSQRRHALKAQVGAETWEQLRNFSKEQRASNYGLGQFTPSPEGWAMFKKAKKRAQQESVSLLAHAGIDSTELKRTLAAYQLKLEQAACPYVRESSHLEAVPTQDVPADVISGDSYRKLSLPFDVSSLQVVTNYCDGGCPFTEFSADQTDGLVGHRSDYVNKDASGTLWNPGNMFVLDLYASIGVWYQPVIAGPLDIFIPTRCNMAHSHIWLDDEFGSSSSSTRLRSALTVSVDPVMTTDTRGPMQEETPLYVVPLYSGNPDNATYDTEWHVPGEEYWFHMTLSDPISANTWNLIKVGVHDFHLVCVDDVSTSQSWYNWWYIDRIFVAS